MTRWIILVGLLGCTSPNMPGEDTDPRVVVVTEDGDEEVTDAGEVSERSHAEIKLCSVIIMFNFAGDRAESVEFENNNDATVIVRATDLTTGGTVAENCLWPDNTDSEEADFSVTDELQVDVYLGQGQFWQYTCVELVDDIVNIFDLCATTSVGFD